MRYTFTLAHSLTTEVAPTPSPGPAPTPTPGPGPSPTPAPPDAVWTDTLFKADSFWYQEIPADHPVHANSAAMVTNLQQQIHSGNLANINIDAYAAPVYIAGAGVPNVSVLFKKKDDEETWVQAWGEGRFAEMGLNSVPIPATAVASAGEDKEIAIYDSVNDRLIELWLAEKISGQWYARWGGVIENCSESNGIFPGDTGASATSLPFLGGMINPSEIARNDIRHALGLAVVWPGLGHSWPAQRDDGSYSGSQYIQEGLRFVLDKDLDVDALDIHPVGKLIAKALQKYGGVVWDRAGSVTLRAHNVIGFTSQGQPDPYPWHSEPEPASWDSTPLLGFPWGSIKFLPANYGQPGSEPVSNGGPIASFTDHFGDNSINTALWDQGFYENGTTTTGVVVAEQNSRIEIALAASASDSRYSGLISKLAYNASGQRCYIRLPQKGSGSSEAQFVLFTSPTTSVVFNANGGNVEMYNIIDGIKIARGTVAYEAGMWLSFLEDADQIHFETAAASATNPPSAWTRRASTDAFDIDYTNVRVNIAAGTWESIASPGIVAFDGFNVGTGG